MGFLHLEYSLGICRAWSIMPPSGILRHMLVPAKVGGWVGGSADRCAYYHLPLTTRSVAGLLMLHPLRFMERYIACSVR